MNWAIQSVLFESLRRDNNFDTNFIKFGKFDFRCAPPTFIYIQVKIVALHFWPVSIKSNPTF